MCRRPRRDEDRIKQKTPETRVSGVACIPYGIQQLPRRFPRQPFEHDGLAGATDGSELRRPAAHRRHPLRNAPAVRAAVAVAVASRVMLCGKPVHVGNLVRIGLSFAAGATRTARKVRNYADLVTRLSRKYFRDSGRGCDQGSLNSLPAFSAAARMTA